MMNIPVEKKKSEAISRMKKWGIFPKTIEQFEEEGKLSESRPPVGACFWVDGKQLQRVKAFEKEHNALVYFIIHSYTMLGEMESYLFVGDDEDEWELDREDIEAGAQLAYVYNIDAPDCSEFGSIGISLTPAAGLRRIW